MKFHEKVHELLMKSKPCSKTVLFTLPALPFLKERKKEEKSNIQHTRVQGEEGWVRKKRTEVVGVEGTIGRYSGITRRHGLRV
jgi:hypothetical protein